MGTLEAGEGGGWTGGVAQRGGRHWQISSGAGAQRTDRDRAAHAVRVPLFALSSEQCALPPDRSVTAGAGIYQRGLARRETRQARDYIRRGAACCAPTS